ncbi:hypothetical protein [Piscinibacter sakaiensis]|uniref:hypothetical protein n=1 Tax=Piscinibacter sakaiensis TaxID=1547922 RepID=UPI003AAEA559
MTAHHHFVRAALRIACVTAGAAVLLVAPAAADTLDGKRFEGVFLAKGKTRGDADTLTFRSGRFHSSACDQYGYSDAPYTTTVEGNATRFDAETESPKYGKLRWTGYIRGDKLDATVMMIQDGKPPQENWVAAGLKK